MEEYFPKTQPHASGIPPKPPIRIALAFDDGNDPSKKLLLFPREFSENLPLHINLNFEYPASVIQICSEKFQTLSQSVFCLNCAQFKQHPWSICNFCTYQPLTLEDLTQHYYTIFLHPKIDIDSLSTRHSLAKRIRQDNQIRKKLSYHVYKMTEKSYISYISKSDPAKINLFNFFKTKEDILAASNLGNSLYSIYQHLEQSEFLLKEQKKKTFELLFEVLLDPFTEEKAQELIGFPVNILDIYAPTISESIAKILSQFSGKWLIFSRVKEIDECVVKTLSNFHGNGIFLNKLQQIDEKVAQVFSQFKVSWLSLSGLPQINEVVAKALAQWKGKELYLERVQELDETTARALSKFEGDITFFNSRVKTHLDLYKNKICDDKLDF